MNQHTYTERTDAWWIASLRGDLGPDTEARAYHELGLGLWRIAFRELRKYNSQNHVGMTKEHLHTVAQEVAQDVIERIYRDELFDEFEGRSKFWTYLYRICAHRVVDVIRREWKFEFLSLPDDSNDEGALPPLVDDSSVDPVTEQARKELWQAVDLCLKTLNERRRFVFMAIAFDDRPVLAIAEELSATRNAIDQLWFYAKKGILECLEGKGWGSDDLQGLYE